MEGELRIIVEKVSGLDRMLNVNAKGLFRGFADTMIGLAKIGTSTGTSDLVNGLAGASEIISGVFTVVEGILSDEKDPVKHRAYVLLYNGIRRGMMALINQHLEVIKEATGINYDAKRYQSLIDQVEAKWAETKLEITYSFFDDCGSFPFIQEVGRLVRDWLMAFGLKSNFAKEISHKFEMFFSEQISLLWNEKPSYFKLVKDSVKDEVGRSSALQRYRYNNKLIKDWENDIFDEPFGLDKLYVPLFACFPFKETDSEGKEEIKHRVVGSEDYILEWLKNREEDQKILILRGGPGSGKSSLMKKIAREVASERDRPVYLVKLQHFKIKDDFETSLSAYFKKTEEHWVDDPNIFAKRNAGKFKSPLLIFDGLDELSRTGASGQELASEFVSKLSATLREKANWDNWDIRAIVTGRDFVIQKVSASYFGSKATVLELLPYCVPKENGNPFAELEGFDTYKFYDFENLLKKDQRSQWWKQFWKARRIDRQDVPEVIIDGEYENLSRHPLLSYLLARTCEAGKLGRSASDNINKIYEELIDSLRVREWDGKEGFRHTTFDNKEQFFRLLEEIAISAWHLGEVRTTSLKYLRKRCEDQQLEGLLENFRLGAKTTLNELVVSFFAKLTKEDSETGDLIEFTHKSFGEYLVARRLVGLAKDVAKTFLKGERRSAENAQFDWRDTCANAVLTQEIWDFVEREVRYKPDLMDEEGKVVICDAASIQSALAKVFSTLINEGFEPRMAVNSLNIINQSRNSEVNLWMMISAFARMSENPTIIGWKDAESVRRFVGWTWFHPDLGFLGKGFHKVVLPERLILFQAFLFLADLRYADLRGSDLRAAVLSSADLRSADLRSADLSSADLNSADLSSADLRSADLFRANLFHAVLGRADLRDADLRGADLRDADLRGADLRGADLFNADLFNADLLYANCYPFRIGGKIHRGQPAFNYLVSRGAENVPLPPEEIEAPIKPPPPSPV